MPKILAIDDSKTMRLAIKITFQAEEGEVVAVSKGSEAVARAKQIGADVVLVDAVLADGEPSGYDVCRALKADPETANIPVLMLVSNQVGVDQAAVTACGAAGAITKPFDTTDLIDKVKAAVGGAGKAPSVAAARPTPTPTPATTRPAPAPAPSLASKPAPAPAPVAATRSPRPTPVPTSAKAAAPTPAAAPASRAPSTGGANIPIVVPIPFTPAHAATAGILRRLSEGGVVEGLDPKAAAAILALSREVIEQVVWEVVPDLAEQIIREQHAN